jgi:hypothetical protein
MSETIIKVDRIVITSDGPVPDRSQVAATIQAELQNALHADAWVDGLASQSVSRAVVPPAPSSTEGNLAQHVAHGVVQAIRGQS